MKKLVSTLEQELFKLYFSNSSLKKEDTYQLDIRVPINITNVSSIKFLFQFVNKDNKVVQEISLTSKYYKRHIVLKFDKLINEKSQFYSYSHIGFPVSEFVFQDKEIFVSFIRFDNFNYIIKINNISVGILNCKFQDKYDIIKVHPYIKCLINIPFKKQIETPILFEIYKPELNKKHELALTNQYLVSVTKDNKTNKNFFFDMGIININFEKYKKTTKAIIYNYLLNSKIKMEVHNVSDVYFFCNSEIVY